MNTTREKHTPARTAEFDLPWPPSVNHYWLPGKGHAKFISEKGRVFRFRVCDIIGRDVNLRTLKTSFCAAPSLAIAITAFPPDRRKRDIDNLLKATLDAIAHAGLIVDDAQFDDIHIVRGERDAEHPHMHITLFVSTRGKCDKPE